MEVDSNKTFHGGDAFLLGYLPNLIRAHFQALEILIQARAGAEGELAARVEARLRALQERGPEIVSCVWKIESILGEQLRVRPPAPPQSEADVETLSRAVEAAFVGAPDSGNEGYRTAYALGARCGAAETAVAVAALHRVLWSAAPGDARLSEQGRAARETLTRFASSTSAVSDCPTMQGEDAAVTGALSAAVAAASLAPDDASADELAKLQAQLGGSARALESAALGTPRASVRAWSDKLLTGAELMRRLAEHQRWRVPCRIGQDGNPEPRVFAFDKRVLLIFSDSRALAERPAFLQNERPEDNLYLTLPGAALFRWLPDDNVDLLVLDPTNDPNAPHTINYPREMHGRLRQAADEVALELSACDWSRLDPMPLRAYSFWILVSGGMVSNLLAYDCYGRPLVGMFSTEAALEAHLARATPEQARDFALCQRVLAPGEALFPSMTKLNVAGFILNPSGPGRTRAFNSRTIEILASG